MDALDEQFSRLKVWRDLNEDGQSSPEELFTLSQLNIRALYTHFEAQDQWQGGNHLTHLGQYETEEGHRHAMGDINFGYQPFYSQFIDKLTLTEEQKAAINLPGVGNVRDLREAATLSPKLAELLRRYRNVTTKAEQQALLPELIEAWAKTGKGYQTYGKALAKTTEYSLPTGGSEGHSDSLSTNDDIQILRVTPQELENIRQAKHDPAVMQRFEANKHKIATLNTLYHLNIQQLYYTTDGDIDYITDKVNRMYEQTLELAYRSLLSQTRLAPYFERLTATSQGTTPKTAEKLTALFDAKFKQSPEAALTDLAEFLSLLPQPRAWAEGLVLLQRYTAYAKEQGIYADWQRDNQATLNVLTDIGFRFGSEGTDAADVFISHDESSTMKGEDGDDTFISGKGNDVLDGSYGADTYIFAKGHGQDVISEYDTYQSGKQDTLRFTDVNYNDVRFRRENDDLILFGYHGNDQITIQNFYNNDYYQIENFQFADRTLSLEDMRREGINFVGTEGDDELTDAHDENEVSFFTGGKGNDVLDGSYGADTYIFAKGHGQDVISEYDTYQSGKQDTLRFTDVNYNDVRFRRENDDLILFGYHGNDRITIRNFYYDDYYQIENFQFADRTLSLAELKTIGMPLMGTDGDDEIQDWDSNAVIHGGDGNDRIYAHDGDDTLIGGKGNDVLDGSYGADTYIFAKGHGQDVISEYDTYQSGKQDTLRFTDVNYNDVRFRRENDDLILFGYHGNDRITIRNFYYDDYYQIENFQFADRTLSLAELKTIGMPLMGTDGDDEIQDWDSNAVIHGGDGNDRIYAHDGDDTLIGGKGNDVLDGSYGADTYIFAKGHGQDVISEYDTYQSGKQDTLRFTDVNYNDVRFRRENNDLILFGYHGNDQITIQNFYNNDYYQIENFQFADRTLSLEDMRREGINFVGTEGDDELTDAHDENEVSFFTGGKGNDVLDGSYGADTYIFAKGHGQDVISEYDTYQSGKQDTLRFTDVNYNDVRFRRENDDLILFGYHGNDRITIRNFYYDDYYQIENFQFADRTLSLAELKTIGMPLMGTDGDDEIQDWDSNAVIHGGDGNDRIYAHDGDDTLIGGKGNDVLDGSYGADTYIFAKGHGQDVISEYDTYQSGKQDRILFEHINRPDELWFSRQGDDLTIKEWHGEESLTIKDWYAHEYYQVEQIQLADGKSLNLSQLDKLIEAMAGFERQHSGDITRMPSNEVQTYLDKIAVSSYWG